MVRWTQQDYEAYVAKQAARSVVGILTSERQCDSRSALVGKALGKTKGRKRMVKVARQRARRKPFLRVGIITCRNHATDSDNAIGGCKQIRDHIAEFFGLTDADSEIVWYYAQIVWPGKAGTIVVIEQV